MPVHFLSDWLLLTGAFLALTAATPAFTANRTKFKAAVYEHAVIPPRITDVTRAEALADMKKNLDIYSEQVKLAKEQGAELIVFPEDGLYDGMPFTRESVLPFLEEIPDPQVVDWSPCQDPSRFNNTEVQYILSCMAREHSMYVVADMGDKQPCNVTDPKCPPDGRYQYNTAVAFGPDGRLLARYHKANLFPMEAYVFNYPKKEVIYFDTPFGRFGLFICFDIFKYDPAVTMVTEYQIANVIFPTDWTDALPLLSAVGFHSAFARAWGVNFLASNTHAPRYLSTGSGLYGPDGVKAMYYNNSASAPPKLVVAELDVLEKPRPPVSVDVPPHSLKFESEKGQSWHHQGIENYLKVAPKPSISDSQESQVSNSDIFYGKLFDDRFAFLEVDGVSGNKTICAKSNKVCCHLDYIKADTTNTNKDGETDLFAFGVFDGMHTLHFNLYFQICTLVRCPNRFIKSSCGAVTTESSTAFKKIEIRGTFETPYVYPEVVLHEPPTDIKLAEPQAWSYDGTTLLTTSDMRSPVVSAGLFGRVYSRDNCSSSDQY